MKIAIYHTYQEETPDIILTTHNWEDFESFSSKLQIMTCYMKFCFNHTSFIKDLADKH